MLRRILQRLLAPRHPWRKVTFSELSEIYLAHFLRTFAIGLVGIFLPLYLYQKGFSITTIFGYYTLLFCFGIGWNYVIAQLIARVGPKHVMRLSFLLQALFSVLTIHINQIPFAIPLLACLASVASGSYFLPYNVDVSKVKHKKHSGKELSFINLAERLAVIVAPIAGGAIATYFVPSLTFAVSGIAMLAAAAILMLTPEPVQTRQRLRFRGLAIKKHWHGYASFAALCGENAIAVLVWPIFLSLVIFTSNAYLQVGFVSSLSMLATIVIAVPLGKLLDNKRGSSMLRLGTFVNTFIHLGRLLVAGLPGAVAVAAVDEPNRLLYRLAHLKGYYDSADDYPGYRIAYLAANEMIADVVRALTFLTLTILSMHYTLYTTCAIGFVLAAAYSYAIRLQRYPALRP